MTQMAQDMQLLLKQRGVASQMAEKESLTATSSKSSSLATKAKPKRKSAMRTAPQPPSPPHVTFAGLDAGVVRAATQAGLGDEVMQEMAKLVQRNPKGAKLADINPAVTGDPLSEDEEVLAEEDGSPPVSGNAVEAALVRLTDIVQSLTEDRKKKQSSSRIDSALDVVSSGSTDGAGIGSGKRSAAARRALRAMLIDHPQEISGMIERLMHEDMTCQTLGPGETAPLTSARGWMEHRSRIGSYRTLAHAASGVPAALDALASGQVASARARVGIVMLQFDQSAIDRGSWYLSSELALECHRHLQRWSSTNCPTFKTGKARIRSC